MITKTESTDFFIKRATPNDRNTVVDMYYAMLLYADSHGYDLDFVPSIENADRAWDDQFLPGIERGDPILLAFHFDDVGVDVVGALFWVEFISRFKLNERMALGWGTYVKPAFRHFGIGRALRSKGMDILKEKEIRSVRGVISSGNDTHLGKELEPFTSTTGLIMKINVAKYVKQIH